MRSFSKATKLVLSILMMITCINLSTVRAEDDGVNAGANEAEITMPSEDVSVEEEYNEIETGNEVVEETTENVDEQENTQQAEETPVTTEVTEPTGTPETTEVSAEETKESVTVEESTEESEVAKVDSNKEINVSETTEQLVEESSEEKTLDKMSSDELFAYIMTLDADQLDALYDEYENLDELMANFTEEQQAELAEKFGSSEEDLEVARHDDGKEERIFASVGDTIDLQGSESPSHEKYYHSWTVISGKEVVSLQCH